MAHQHYTGTGKMHSFRGLLADGAQDKIRIQGATGEIAWRIVKFQIIGNAVGTSTYDSVVQIFREQQSSIVATVDFDNVDLLAAAYFTSRPVYTSSSLTITFDNTLFSRNIFVTHNELFGSASCNYYIELEEVKVSKAGMAQLSVAAARRLGLNP